MKCLYSTHWVNSEMFHSAIQEALCEDEGESGPVPLSCPHVRQPQAIHQGT